MQLLQLHTEFMLPDNFEGTLSDALREMAEYIETPEAGHRETVGAFTAPEGTSISILDWQKRSLQRLKEINKKDGSRTVFDYFLGNWDD